MSSIQKLHCFDWIRKLEFEAQNFANNKDDDDKILYADDAIVPFKVWNPFEFQHKHNIFHNYDITIQPIELKM